MQKIGVLFLLLDIVLFHIEYVECVGAAAVVLLQLNIGYAMPCRVRVVRCDFSRSIVHSSISM
jgi:hypothetical protein